MYLELFCTHTHRLKGNNHPNAEINMLMVIDCGLFLFYFLMCSYYFYEKIKLT